MVHNKEQLKCNQCNHPTYNVLSHLSNVPFGASFLAVLLKDRLFARGTTLPAAQRRPRLVLEESEGSTSQRVNESTSQGEAITRSGDVRCPCDPCDPCGFEANRATWNILEPL